MCFHNLDKKADNLQEHNSIIVLRIIQVHFKFKVFVFGGTNFELGDADKSTFYKFWKFTT